MPHAFNPHLTQTDLRSLYRNITGQDAGNATNEQLLELLAQHPTVLTHLATLASNVYLVRQVKIFA